MNKKQLIDELFVETSTYNHPAQAEMAAALLNTVASDIYSESERFVFELIQNADDAASGDSNEIYFDFLPNSLIVSHNGKAFNENDVRSLTTAGSSTKKADPKKTGYKGIGFKSVFGISKKVTVFSDGFQFRFDKEIHKGILPWQVIPIWTNADELPFNIQQRLKESSHNVSTILELDNTTSLENDLKKLISNGHILLFLRHISKISISKNGNAYYSIEKNIILKSKSFNEIQLIENSNPISNWITRTFEEIPVSESTQLLMKQDEKTPDKLKTSEFTEVSYAAKVENGKIKSLKHEESLIFTYLPTKVNDFQFPFLVNSSFMTNAARESINSDVSWNQWLFGLVAEKMFDWLSELSQSEYKFQVLHLLPTRFNDTSNDLKKSFNKSYNKCFNKKPFITTTQENTKNSKEVIYDLTGLSKQSFIDPKSITEFIHKESRLHFDDDCFVHSAIEEPGKLKLLSVETFELDSLQPFFLSEHFTARHSISHNFDLIAYFKEMSDLDTVGEWFQHAKTLPFIYSEDEVLYNPSYGICFPSDIGTNSTELGSLPVIHFEVYKQIQSNTAVFEWLKELGVKHPSEIAYVTNVIIPNIRAEGFINVDNYLLITFNLFRLYWERALSESILESLRELPLRIKNDNLSFVQSQHCYLSNRYNPNLKLEGIIGDISFVSEAYLGNNRAESEWNIFFKAIKVKEKIEIETIDNNNTLATLQEITDHLWVTSCDSMARAVPEAFGFGSHNVIGLVKIPSFLNITTSNVEYSKIFWKNLLEAPSDTFTELTSDARFRYGVGYGRNSYSTGVENYFPWFVKNKQCIPTTQGILDFSRNIYINNKEIKDIAGNYFPVFDYDDNITDNWKSLLNFKNKLENNDYFSILEKIVAQSEADPGHRPPITRIGQIYNKLASLLPDFSRDWKEYLSVWAAKNKLYATNGKFESASLLKYITIEGFSAESDNFKIIHIPSNCKKDSNFTELLSLLEIQTINKFEPTFQNKNNESTLKDVLEDILPYFAAVIEKKKPDEYSNQFGRLFNLIDNTFFYTADEISLSFNHQGEQIAGPTLTVFRENLNFYFKGKWSNERTLLSLIKELSNHLEIYGFNEELGFLLRENDKSEILEWIKEMGISENSLKKKKIFTKRAVPTISLPIHVEKPLIIDNPILIDFTDAVNDTPFIPDYNPDSYDMGNVSFQKKNFSVATQNGTITYSEIGSDLVRSDIGLWSEEFVYGYLCSNCNYSDIVWENQYEESGKPYDIRFLYNGVEKFIDVKGTPSDTKDLIYISQNEWLFMLNKEDKYSIIRVYGVGQEYPRIVEFENIRELLLTGQIFPHGLQL